MKLCRGVNGRSGALASTPRAPSTHHVAVYSEDLDAAKRRGPGRGQEKHRLRPVHCASVAAVPLPAALPLFATGLGVMAWLGRRGPSWTRCRTVLATATGHPSTYATAGDSRERL